MSSTITPGLILLTLSQLSYSLGSFIADFNETHVLNPRWPPHARFHNGQTMSLAVLLCSLSLYHLWRPKPTNDSKPVASSATTTPSTTAILAHVELEKCHADLLMSALIGSLYVLAGLSAIFYPGSDWLDPEFIRAGEPRRPQLFIFTGILGLVWVGWGLEERRLRKVGDGGKGKGKIS